MCLFWPRVILSNWWMTSFPISTSGCFSWILHWLDYQRVSQKFPLRFQHLIKSSFLAWDRFVTPCLLPRIGLRRFINTQPRNTTRDRRPRVLLRCCVWISSSTHGNKQSVTNKIYICVYKLYMNSGARAHSTLQMSTFQTKFVNNFCIHYIILQGIYYLRIFIEVVSMPRSTTRLCRSSGALWHFACGKTSVDLLTTIKLTGDCFNTKMSSNEKKDYGRYHCHPVFTTGSHMPIFLFCLCVYIFTVNWQIDYNTKSIMYSC